MEQEVWKQFRDTEYEASSLGRIRSWKSRKKPITEPRVLKLSKSWNGYSMTFLFIAGKNKGLRVARVVYEAFNGPIEEGFNIDHIDNDKTNDRLDNLQKITFIQNQHRKDLFGSVKRGAKSNWAVLTPEQVLEIRELLKTDMSQREIGKIYGVHNVTICNIKTGKNWKHLK